MNRAEWRRARRARVRIAEPGLHFDGTLELLGKICANLREGALAEGFPGARRPAAEMIDEARRQGTLAVVHSEQTVSFLQGGIQP